MPSPTQYQCKLEFHVAYISNIGNSNSNPIPLNVRQQPHVSTASQQLFQSDEKFRTLVSGKIPTTCLFIFECNVLFYTEKSQAKTVFLLPGYSLHQNLNSIVLLILSPGGFCPPCIVLLLYSLLLIFMFIYHVYIDNIVADFVQGGFCPLLMHFNGLFFSWGDFFPEEDFVLCIFSLSLLTFYCGNDYIFEDFVLGGFCPGRILSSTYAL